MNQVRVKIMAINLQPVRTEFTGIIRKEDVRLVEMDKVQIYNCFRPGDILKANVISLVSSYLF